MNHSRLIIRCCNSLLIIFALLLQSQTAIASVTTFGCANTDTSCTLQELFDGGSFEVDGLRFSNWSLVSSSYSTPDAPDPSLIDVEIYDSDYLDSYLRVPGEGPGFMTNDGIGIHGSEFRDFRYTFQVSTLDNNLVININTLLMQGLEAGGGDADIVGGLIEVNERVTDSQSNELATKQISAELGGDENFKDIVEFTPQSILLVETGFLEEGSDLNDDLSFINLLEYMQRFGYAAPIPTSALDTFHGSKTTARINPNGCKNAKLDIPQAQIIYRKRLDIVDGPGFPFSGCWVLSVTDFDFDEEESIGGFYIERKVGKDYTQSLFGPSFAGVIDDMGDWLDSQNCGFMTDEQIRGCEVTKGQSRFSKSGDRTSVDLRVECEYTTDNGKTKKIKAKIKGKMDRVANSVTPGFDCGITNGEIFVP